MPSDRAAGSAGGESPRPGRRRALRIALVSLACCLVLALCWSLSIPGCLSVDEVTYLLSARSLALGHGIEVWNGFEEQPSQELAPAWLKVIGGRLVSQYPDFFLFLGLPAYRLLGFRGLFLVNSLAFLGVVALTWGIARDLYGRRAAAVSIALLTLATFSLEYAAAGWPHMTSALMTVLPLFLLVKADRAPDRSRRLALVLLAGLVAGFGVGVRLDVVFSAAGLGVALLLCRPARVRDAAGFLAGMLPPLAALALVNQAKFGLLSPFTYGPSFGIAQGLGPYIPVALLAGFALVLLFGATRPAWNRRLVLGAVAAVVAGVGVALFLVPGLRELGSRAARGTWELLVDLRIRPLEERAPALWRGPGGSFVYFGSLKKALLQSCPFLVLLLVPVVDAIREGRGRRRVLLLATAPAFLIGLYCFFGWDGGLSLNQRYFVPALPMLVVLVAAAFGRLERQGRVRGAWIAAVAAAAVLAFLLASRVGEFDFVRQGAVLLTAPLVLAGALLASLLPLLGRSPRPRAARLALLLGLASVAWSAMTSLAYDLPRTLARRSEHAWLGTSTIELARSEMTLFSEPVELLATAADGGYVPLANPAMDRYATFAPLARGALREGRDVFLAAGAQRLALVRQLGLLDGLELEPVLGGVGSIVCRVRDAGATGVSERIDARPEG